MTAPETTEVAAAFADTVVEAAKREIKRCPECAQNFGADARFCPFDGSPLETLPWDPSQDSLLGVVVDERYEVCAVLGEGGMGTVYKVRHVALDRMFAMKVLRKDLARDEDLAARFTQEARATASIKHPNIVQITDFGRLPDDVPYFVMELLTGQPLSVALKSRGIFPHGEACQIVLKIAGALGAAHDAGIVHRDLKPENVFLLGRGANAVDGDDVRIVDFGAAKIMGASRITKTGIVFGTPHFMSPEQASGASVDHRADIYALGVIMYELFTGVVPFEADTYMGVLTQHMFVAPQPPSTVSEHAKDLGPLEAVILRALEKKPEARFASMGDLASEIRRVVRFAPNGEAVITSEVSGSKAPPRIESGRPSLLSSSAPAAIPRGASPWLVAIAGGGIAAAAALAIWFALRPGAPPPPPRPAPVITATAPVPAPLPALSAPAPIPAASGSAATSASASATAAPLPKRPPRPPPRPPRPSDPEFVDPWKKDRP